MVLRRFERFLKPFSSKNLAFDACSTSSRLVRRAFLYALVAAALTGCMASRSSTDKLLDAAHEHNGAVRFGRMDIALEHVAAASKGEWLQRRASWKNSVRIIDLELEGMQLPAIGEANVQIRVSWQRVDEADVRSTEVTQQWRVSNGPWQLVDEACTGGDTTLLGEKTKEKKGLTP